jgi:alkylated DNA repair dioxygenase AlkB
MSFADTEISGLYYIPNAFDDQPNQPDWDTELSKFLDAEVAPVPHSPTQSEKYTVKWHSIGSATSSRRVAHYGYAYQYKTGKATTITDPMPPIIEKLRDAIKDMVWAVQNPVSELCTVPIDETLNQCIINEYLPSQGIGAHIDNASYGDWICCYTHRGSNASGACIEFTRGPTQKIEKYIEPGSIYFMSGESRYLWKHEQRPRKNDKVNGVAIPRSTRTSFTFRTVVG